MRRRTRTSTRTRNSTRARSRTRKGLRISHSKKKQIAALAIILAASIFLSPFLATLPRTGYAVSKPAAQACQNECFYTGETQCSSRFLQTCGNYDNDKCLEWSTGLACSNGCENGKCLPLSEMKPVQQAVQQTNQDTFWQTEKCETFCADYATKYYQWETVCKWYVTSCSGCAMCGGNL
jgi:hypothetical protein